MGFYYGSSEPPPEKSSGGLKEVVLITWVVFRTLALPIGILLGGMMYLFLIFFLFTIHPLAGLASILLIFAAIGARGVWEWRHPPRIEG